MDTQTLERVVVAYNTRSKGYRKVTAEEVLKLLADKNAMVCEFCGALLLRGFSSLDYNYKRHLNENRECVEIRFKLALKRLSTRERERLGFHELKGLSGSQ